MNRWLPRLRSFAITAFVPTVCAMVLIAASNGEASSPKRTQSNSKPSTEAVVPPIEAASGLTPIPKDTGLALLLASEVQDLIKERRAFLARSAAKTGSAQSKRVANEIQVLEKRLANGPDVQLLVKGISAQVEKIRGLKLRRPVTVDVMNRNQMQTLVEEKLEEDLPPQGLRRTELHLKAVGNLNRSLNLRAVLIRLISEQAAGLYDPATKKLYVSDSFSLDRPIARIILAHEINHALQDQYFDIRSMMKKVSDQDDRAAATLAVIEGDATMLMGQYAVEYLTMASPTDFLELLTQDQRAFRSAPYYLRQSLVFPYLAGQDFLFKVAGSDYELTNEVFRNPPQSTEQIYIPAKYNKKPDLPTSITLISLPGDGAAIISDNGLGQFGIRTLFELWKSRSAVSISEGWDGDRVQVWTPAPSGKTLDLDSRDLETSGLSVLWQSVWDTPEDAREFAEAITQLYVSGPYRKELVQATGENGQIKTEKMGADGRINFWLVEGKYAELRVYQCGHGVALLLIQDNLRTTWSKFPHTLFQEWVTRAKNRD